MIRLTQTVQKGGCAAKVSASELRKILSQLKFPPKHEALKVDSALFDDAAIYQVSNEVSLVQTLDFFTPIVDTPEIFGAVAATNALSDVYAMGGVPKTAMAILAFPLASMESDVIVKVLQGACDKIAEAGATLVGGHSIDDDTLKFGLSVTGYVHPKKVWSNAGAKPGDLLVLTKALGTGTLTAALKRDELKESEIQDALDSMMQLNDVVKDFSEFDANAIHAATDITGFALNGHAMQMAKASQVSMRIQMSVVPSFEKAKQLLSSGFLTKAHRTNKEYTENFIDDAVLTPTEQLLINDPQTSGGLLLSIDPSAAKNVLTKIKKRFPHAAIIGEVLPQDKLSIYYSK